MSVRTLPLAAVLAFAAPALAATKPDKVAITPATTEAAILVQAPRTGVDYVLGLSAFDPATSELKTNSFSGGWVNLDIPSTPRVGWGAFVTGRAAKPEAEPAGTPVFVVQRVKPGTYVVRDVTQQTKWAACFAKDTVQLTVKAGEVVYLGNLDADTPLREIQRDAVSHMQLSAGNGTVYHYADNITPPRLTLDEAGLAAARAFAADAMPKSSVTPIAARYQAARFGIGKTLFGQTVCGGYFRKKVRPAESAPVSAGAATR